MEVIFAKKHEKFGKKKLFPKDMMEKKKKKSGGPEKKETTLKYSRLSLIRSYFYPETCYSGKIFRLSNFL